MRIKPSRLVFITSVLFVLINLAFKAPNLPIVKTLQFTYTESLPYRSFINHAYKAYGLRTNLIEAVIQIESSWKVTAKSDAGAIGLMQIMPANIPQLKFLGITKKEDLFIPEKNILAGSWFLTQAIIRHKNLKLALIEYNIGLPNMKNQTLFARGEIYARKILQILG